MDYRVIDTAFQQLNKYIYLMTGTGHQIDILVDADAFHVEDAVQDDAYHICVASGNGTITASNARSALIAVYHLLRHNGCGFPRPGLNSERIPQKHLSQISAQLSVAAGHRFRGICIEGACDPDIVIDLIEWMPKVGLNCYFMQFREGYNFFERWYGASNNPAVSPWEFNVETCRTLIPQITYAAHRNGLMYHGVGHGFTCECFGVYGLGWIEMDNWPKEAEYALAMRNGVRDLAHRMPLISALCYSDPHIQSIVVDHAAAYIAQHPEMDYVHFWLDDGHNNKCECEKCSGTKIADFYVDMLNRLDEQLNERNVDTKIVFLAYHELLWTPDYNKIKNPARFTFMFAPIQRSFLQPLSPVAAAGEPQPYCLNKQPFPLNNEEMAAHLKAWNLYREEIGMPLSDSFDFDYYFKDYNDPGQFVQAQLVYQDVKSLKNNGLGGLINCQSQRLFDHAALPQYVMSRTLMQPELTFDEIVDEFFNSAFGEDGAAYKAIWQHWTEASTALRNSEEHDFHQLQEALRRPLPNTECKDIVTSHSRKIMRFTAEIYLLISELVKQVRLQDADQVEKIKAEIDRFTCNKEMEFATEFERNYFCAAINDIVAPMKKV